MGYIVGSLLVETVAGWRYMYGVSIPLSLIMGIGMWWLPASPRWILLRAKQGKGNVQSLRENAITCLCRLRGQNISDSAPKQVDEILSELSHVREEQEAKIAEMFQGKCLKALIIGVGLVLFQQVLFIYIGPCFIYIFHIVSNFCSYLLLSLLQITGQPSVLYYAATIFRVHLLNSL